MQHLAIHEDSPFPDFATGKYQWTQDVNCPKCRIAYGLWSPDLETEPDAVKAQATWLEEELGTKCPDHPEFFLTLDRP